MVNFPAGPCRVCSVFITSPHPGGLSCLFDTLSDHLSAGCYPRICCDLTHSRPYSYCLEWFPPSVVCGRYHSKQYRRIGATGYHGIFAFMTWIVSLLVVCSKVHFVLLHRSLYYSFQRWFFWFQIASLQRDKSAQLSSSTVIFQFHALSGDSLLWFTYSGAEAIGKSHGASPNIHVNAPFVGNASSLYRKVKRRNPSDVLVF